VPKLDPRVRLALKVLRDELGSGRKCSLQHLGDIAGLSPSRLMHVFTESVGVPLRPYILWLCLQQACSELMNGDGGEGGISIEFRRCRAPHTHLPTHAGNNPGAPCGTAARRAGGVCRLMVAGPQVAEPTPAVDFTTAVPSDSTRSGAPSPRLFTPLRPSRLDTPSGTHRQR
jgi:AraC-like DNA-binding protein